MKIPLFALALAALPAFVSAQTAPEELRRHIEKIRERMKDVAPLPEPVRDRSKDVDPRSGPAEGPQAALEYERSFRGRKDAAAKYSRYPKADPLALKGLANVTELRKDLWSPEQLSADFLAAKRKNSALEGILVFIKTEFCSVNDARLCSVTTAALEKQATPLLRRFKVYGAWVKGNPERMTREWFAWEDKVIDTYQFEQGPGSKLVAFLPGSKTMYFSDAQKLELTADRFEKAGGAVPKLETFLEGVLKGTIPEGRTTQVARPGDPAPDFSLPRLSGGMVSPRELRGKVVLLQFWASWCVYCRLAAPTLNSLHDEFPKELAVLAVNVKEPRAEILKYVAETRLKPPVAHDVDAQVFKELYNAKGLPHYVLIDKDGKILANDFWPPEKLRERVLAALGR